MTELYRVRLGSYEFEAARPSITETSINRVNAFPAVRVASLFECTLRCRIPAPTDALSVPPSAATALGTFLAAAVHADTLPTGLTIVDQGGNPIPQIGNITDAGGWEDLQVTRFEILDSETSAQPGQLVAGAWFVLTFTARLSLPDADGVCEFEQPRDVTSNSLGQKTINRKTKLRFSKASYLAGTRVTSAAILARVQEPCPPGFIRTIGSVSTNGIRYTTPLYPLEHVVEVESEVTANVEGIAGATATHVSIERKDDPAKGLVRVMMKADTIRATSGAALDWVLAKQPDGTTADVTDLPTEHKATGEFRGSEVATGVAALVPSRVRRSYVLRGGARAARPIPMATGVSAVIQRGAFEPWRMSEGIDLFVLGLTDITHLPLPDPLGAPWVLDGSARVDALPTVDEEHTSASQRGWRRVVQREYLWDGEGSPLDDAKTIALVVLDATDPAAMRAP